MADPGLPFRRQSNCTSLWALVIVVLLVLLMTQDFLDLDNGLLALIAGIGFGIQALLLIFGHRAYDFPDFQPEKPENLIWKDYIAVADIVPDGPITPMSEKETISEIVYNLHSLKDDHGSYWQNKGEFLADVNRRLFAHAGFEDLAPDDQSKRTLEEAKRRHRSRVNSYFGAGLISLWSVPLLWFSMGPLLGTIGEPFRKFVVDFLPQGLRERELEDQFWNTIIGAGIVLLGVYLWHQWVVRRLWNWWTKKEEEAMFERNMEVKREGTFIWFKSLFSAFQRPGTKEERRDEDASSEVKSAAAWFLLVSSLLPLISLGLAMLGGFLFRWTGWSWVLMALSLVVFFSRWSWASFAWRALWQAPKEVAMEKQAIRLPSLIRPLGRFVNRTPRLSTVIGLFLVYILLTAGLYFWVGPAVDGQCTVRESLDSRLVFYTEEDAYEMIKSCTDEGRAIYAWSEVFDIVVYPVVFAVAAAMGIVLTSHTFLGRGNGAKWLAVVPLLGLLLDWTENISILTMIFIFPDRFAPLGHYLGVASPLKWYIGIAAAILAVGGIIWVAIGRIFIWLRRNPSPA